MVCTKHILLSMPRSSVTPRDEVPSQCMMRVMCCLLRHTPPRIAACSQSPLTAHIRSPQECNYEKKPQFSSAGKVNFLYSCPQMITSVRAVLLVLLPTPASASCAKVQGKTCWRSASPVATRNTMDILELSGRWGKRSGTWGWSERWWVDRAWDIASCWH